MARSIARIQVNAAILDSTRTQILSEGGDAIELYHGANRKARSTREPAYFVDDAFMDAAPPSNAEMLEDLTSALGRATANVNQCKSQIAGARAQLEAEYHSFYDDELLPFLKGIADAASVSVRTEFVDPLFEQKNRAAPPTDAAEDAPVDALSLKRPRGPR